MSEVNDILKRLIEADGHSQERAHEEADELLLTLIQLLAKQASEEDQAVIQEIIQYYNGMEKWFA